tara:strand:- start:444 stop:662 length:219 start_codon:yes stop_codon:yes gene_type:complete
VATRKKKEEKPQILTIDGEKYSLDELNDDAKKVLASLRYADRKLSDLRAEGALVATARTGYISILKKELKKI